MAETISGYTILGAPWAQRALALYEDDWFQGCARKSGAWTGALEDGAAVPLVYCLFDRGVQADLSARSIAVEYDLACQIRPELIGTFPAGWATMPIGQLRAEAEKQARLIPEAALQQYQEGVLDLPGAEDAPTKKEVLDAIRSGGEFVGEVGGTVADAAGSVFGSALGGALKGFLKSNPWIIPALALYAVVKLA